MKKQAPSDDTAHPRSHQTRRRVLWILLLAVTGAIAVSWRLLVPDLPAGAPGALTERDKREIAHLCRRYTIRFAADRLRRADFGWFSRSARVLFQQRIHRFIDHRDGTYRVYVVVYDHKEPDGFSAWSRHQVTKTNGHWTILRSY